MKTLIGIRREDINKWERRVPLIPSHVRELMRELPVEIWMQPSALRIFPDDDYRREGARVEEDLSPCSIIFAVKEIPLSFFWPGKTYVFFSHTVKGQPHNMPMLKRMIELGATLIDYEKIVDERGRRLVFFGRQAGYAGMIDTLWALGRRLEEEGIKTPFSHIRQTFHYASLVEAKEVVQKVGWEISRKGFPQSLAPCIFGFTGYGHVSQGAQEIFGLLPFEEIGPEDINSFVSGKSYSSNRVYKAIYREEHLVAPKFAAARFELQDYYDHPEKYKSVFEDHLPHLTVVVNGIYWMPKYPKFITKSFLKRLFGAPHQPRLRVIGDISCDVDGAMECTVKATNPDHPVFVYDTILDRDVDGFKGRGPVVMSVYNLPAEISLESSVFFSQTLKPFVAHLAVADFSRDFASCRLSDSLKKAMILYKGEFTPAFKYMKGFVS